MDNLKNGMTQLSSCDTRRRVGGNSGREELRPSTWSMCDVLVPSFPSLPSSSVVLCSSGQPCFCLKLASERDLAPVTLSPGYLLTSDEEIGKSRPPDSLVLIECFKMELSGGPQHIVIVEKGSPKEILKSCPPSCVILTWGVACECGAGDVASWHSAASCPWGPGLSRTTNKQTNFL